MNTFFTTVPVTFVHDNADGNVFFGKSRNTSNGLVTPFNKQFFPREVAFNKLLCLLCSTSIPYKSI